MIRNILICFVIALPLAYGFFKYDTRSNLQCWSLAEEDISYWYAHAQKGDKIAAQQLLNVYANPKSKYFNKEAALFWFFILGDDHKNIYTYTSQSEISSGLNSETKERIYNSAKNWKPSEKYAGGRNYKAIACGFSKVKISDQCGDLLGIDGGHALDGPYYFVNRKTGAYRGSCSFWTGKCVVPIEWTCECPKMGNGRLNCDKGYSDEEREKLQKSRQNRFMP